MTFPSSIVRNTAALYAVHFASLAIPLLEIPILARALGADLYGRILFCQGLALSASVVAEYGFNLNAAQQAALGRQRAQLATLFGQVLCAKVLLVVPLAAAFWYVWWRGWASSLLADPLLVPFALAYFIAFSFSPMWYFQGIERMPGPALLDVVLRLGGVVMLALRVGGPADFHAALWLLAIPPLLNTILTLAWARRDLGPVGADWRGALRQLRDGFHFFVYRGAASLAMAAVPVALGAAAGSAAVGLFVPAEKLIRGMTSLAQPLLMALYPVCARVMDVGGAWAYGIAARLVVAVGMGAVAMTGVGLWLGADVLRGLLGAGFDETYVVFGWLLGLVPLRVLDQAMAMVLLIPGGRARRTSYAISGFSLMAVLLGAALAPAFGGRGMAVGLLCGEACLCAVLSVMSWRLWRERCCAPATSPQVPLRILLVSTGLHMGGAERQVVDLADTLAARGHSVAIASLLGSVALQPAHPQIRVFALRCGRTPLGLLRGYVGLAALAYRWRPDVVHSHMVHANLMARLVRLAVPMGRLVCTAHSSREGGRMLMLAYRLTHRLADATTHVSDEAARRYERIGAVPRGGMVTVHNGIDMSRFITPSPVSGWLPRTPGDRRVVLSVGRLVPEKDQAALLRAFALVAPRHIDVDLWLVGDGPLRADLERLRGELALDGRAYFLGQRTDVPALMHRADLLVLSSRVEGFGLVLVEAMAARMLVVATDVGGVAEVMNGHGILVAPNDVAALARGMKQALDLSPAEVMRRTMRGRDYVRQRFDIQRVTDRWLDIYRAGPC